MKPLMTRFKSTLFFFFFLLSLTAQEYPTYITPENVYISSETPMNVPELEIRDHRIDSVLHQMSREEKLSHLNCYGTIFPSPLSKSCSWDVDAIENVSRIRAKEATQYELFPIIYSANGGIYNENQDIVGQTFGEDPFLSNSLLTARKSAFSNSQGINNASLTNEEKETFSSSQLNGFTDNNRINEDQLNEAVRKVLNVQYNNSDYNHINSIDEQEARNINHDITRKSLVLIKNDNQTLPLKKNKQLLVIGSLANKPLGIKSNYMDNTKTSCTLVDAIRKQAGRNATVTYIEGNKLSAGENSELNAILSLADRADAIIYVMGEEDNSGINPYPSFRKEISKEQKQLLGRLSGLSTPVIVLLLNDQPLELESPYKQANAILECWCPGTEGAPAIAEVLFGNYAPSGKLTVSIPRSADKEKNDNITPVTNNNTYPATAQIDTIFLPFGYGLSYTTFEYSKPVLSSDNLNENVPVTVSVNVKNTGKYDGEEIVQLYIERPGESQRELHGFRRVALKKGESRNVSFTLTPNDLVTPLSEDTKIIPGDYKIYIGSNSWDVQGETLVYR